MSFKLKNKEELIGIGAAFNVVLEPDQTKNEMLEELEKQEVTWDMWKEKQEQEQEERSEMVLLKMERANRTYETHGARFTHDHPYVLVTRQQADQILGTEDGFRMASPQEAERFYS